MVRCCSHNSFVFLKNPDFKNPLDFFEDSAHEGRGSEVLGPDATTTDCSVSGAVSTDEVGSDDDGS